MTKTEQIPVWPKRVVMLDVNEHGQDITRWAWVAPADGWPHESGQFHEIEFSNN